MTVVIEKYICERFRKCEMGQAYRTLRGKMNL